MAPKRSGYTIAELQARAQIISAQIIKAEEAEMAARLRWAATVVTTIPAGAVLLVPQ